jgi:hypothetical protein
MADSSQVLKGKRGTVDIAFEKVAEDFATRYASTHAACYCQAQLLVTGVSERGYTMVQKDSVNCIVDNFFLVKRVG